MTTDDEAHAMQRRMAEDPRNYRPPAELPVRPVLKSLVAPPHFTAPAPGMRFMQFNEGAWPPSPRVAAAVAAAAKDLNHYGDSHWSKLTPAIASALDFDPACIICGNGSAEIISLASTAFIEPGRNAVVSTPSFPRLGGNARIAGGAVKTVPVRPDGAHDIEALLRAVDADTRLFWLTTPNNPTGASVTAEELTEIRLGLPEHCILAVDEAYGEFSRADGGIDAFHELRAWTKPWFVMRTFSKAYGLAGLRVGYAMMSSEALADAFHRVRSTFNLNVIAQAGALAAFQDADYMWARVKECVAERERVRAGAEALGLRCFKSAGNFLLIELAIDGAAAQAAIRKHGVAISTVKAPGYERCIRVTIGLKDDNDAFLAALAATV